MRRGTRVFGALALVMSAAAVPSLTGANAAPRADFETRALEEVSRANGIAIGELEIVTRATSHLPYSHVDLADYKVGTRDGRLFGVSFDKATENTVAAQSALNRESQAREAAVGKQDEALRAHFQRNAVGAAPVAFWVAFADPGDLGRRPGGIALLRSKIRAAQAPVVAALQRQGASPAVADLAPVVFADLGASQTQSVEGRQDVAAVNLVPTDLKRMIDDSATSNRYPYAWNVTTGTGTKVAVHEDDGVDNANNNLQNATHGISYYSDSISSSTRNIGSHATEVAGVMASSNAWRRGGAFNTGAILSANFLNFSDGPAIVNSASWASSQGADVINLSWGGCTSGAQNFFSRWIDFEQKALATNFVVSSGNTPNCSGSLFVASPSLGWNTLSVGSYYDHDTGLLGDDTFSSFTEYQNPTDPNSGRTYEKPDVTAMGGEFTNGVCFGVGTTGLGSGVRAETCGTSFSSPDAAALVADVKQSVGHGSPEAVKAIVMAGAVHNIIDDLNYRSCPSSPIANDCRDGAGGIDAKQTISNVVTPGQYRQRLESASTLPAGNNIDIPVSVTAGKRVRAVIAWDSTAACTNLGTSSQACASDLLNADLDLSVLNPSNSTVASSSSFQNSAEVVDFVAPTTGTYTIRVHSFRFDAGTNTFLGIAWNTNVNAPLDPLTGVTPIALNTTLNNQTNNRGHSFWDTYSAGNASCNTLLRPETGLEKVYRFTTTRTGKITASLSLITQLPNVSKNVDVILIKQSGAAQTLNQRVITCGDNALTANSQPAGTYLLVVDGRQPSGGTGSVANYSIRLQFS
jgi:hypothetical protein